VLVVLLVVDAPDVVEVLVDELVDVDVVQQGLNVVDVVDPPAVVEVLVDVEVLVVSQVSE
jgi:hypothetical protein